MFINWKRLLLAVWRLEEGMQEVLKRLEAMEAPKQSDAWVQSGIDNIMSFSVGKKKEDA